MATINAVGVGLSGASGTGAFAGTTSPTFVTPILGTPTSGTLTNCTGLLVAGGGTGLASLTTYTLLAGGTTSTGNMQQVSAGTTGQLLQSNGSSALPSFTTATFPATATSAGTILRADGTNWVASTATFANTYSASNLLYSNGANTVTGLTTANSAVLVTNSSGVPAWSGTMTNGQVVIGSTSGTPAAATLTAGTNVTITNAANSITINAGTGGINWAANSNATITAAANNGYILTNSGATTVNLPASPLTVGSIIGVAGQNGSFTVNIGASTNIIAFGTVYSTSFASANNSDVLVLLATTTTQWNIISMSSKGMTAS